MKDTEGTTGQSRQVNQKSSRSRLLVFLICLVISVIIWFLIVLSKESYITLDFPVIYENSPGAYVLSGQQDSIISFTVSSGGLDLLAVEYLNRKFPIRIDLTNVKVRKDGDLYWSGVPTSVYSAQVMKRMHLSAEHVTVTPDFLNLKFEPISGRKVKIIPKLKLEFEKQYKLCDSIFVVPDSVNILGQKEIIENIPFIETETRELLNVNANQTFEAGLDIPAGYTNIKLVPEKAEVSFNVEKYTESKVEVPVTCQKPELKIKTFPEFVTITYNVGLKDFSRVNKDSFLAQVSYIPGDSSSKLNVDLVRYPSFIQIVRIEPEEVEFLILKK
jgi:YbbR domain-containing protein